MVKIKAVIFDLDDTLFDCTGQLVEAARQRSAEAMANNIPGTSAGELLKMQDSLYEKHGPTFDVFDRICEELKVRDSGKCITAALRAYNSDEVGNILLFPEALPLLKSLREKGLKLILITSGIHSRQQRKIDVLGLEKLVDLFLIYDVEKSAVSKTELFRKALGEFSLKPNEVVSLGDRIQSEIKISNRLGLNTVRMLHGRFKDLKPKNNLEEADFEISSLAELEKAISRIEKGKNGQPRVVAIGGGTGLPLVLTALMPFTNNLTAVVTVTDSGRSSGILRTEMDVLPPGDIRNCLIALSSSDSLMNDLFKYRFSNGKLEDVSFGNIFIATLCKVTGSFEKAVKETSKILAIKGRVLPSTLEDVHICAEFLDGKVIETEDKIIDRDRPYKELAERAPIKRVFLKPNNAKLLPEAKKAILEADAVIIGPGSLFTSVISNLLVKGMKEALQKTKAKKIYVANVMTQVNQTHGFKLSDHVKTIEEYLGKGTLDFVVFNSKKPSKETLDDYEEEQSFFIEPDLENIKQNGLKLVGKDIVEHKEKSKEKATKQNLLRHDAKKLGKVLSELI